MIAYQINLMFDFSYKINKQSLFVLIKVIRLLNDSKSRVLLVSYCEYLLAVYKKTV